MSEATDTDTDIIEEPDAAEGEEINLRIDEVTKIFQDDEGNDVVAVDDITINVRRGEFLVLVGPSGCGKTTTLRSVAGLETPTEGRIIIEDTDVTGLNPRERDISMVFQNYALYPHKTVRGNISFPLEVRNYPDDQIEKRVKETAELLDISELLDRKPGQLSGGQQQRVALGRAIIREPAVFLMDEPLSNLDAKLRVQMRTELNELHKRVGKTTIYVTHDQAEAMTLGDRVAVMNDGKLQQLAPPQHLYDQPVNRFVAGFIGEPPMNFFDVDVEEQDDGYSVSSEMLNFQLPGVYTDLIDDWEGSLDSVTLGVRPENVHVDDEGIEHASPFEAYVRVVEPLGSEQIVTLSPSEDSTREFTTSLDPDADINEDDTISLFANTTKVHLFDDTTGQNITYRKQE